jgi:hypothetical protein
MAPREVFDQLSDLLREPLARRGGGFYHGGLDVTRPLWGLNPDEDLVLPTEAPANEAAPDDGAPDKPPTA